MATEYKIGLDPEIRKLMEERGLTFDNNNTYKPKRQLMATDVIRELKKLIEENGDKPVFVSTGLENVIGDNMADEKTKNTNK